MDCFVSYIRNNKLKEKSHISYMFPVAFYWPFEGGDFDVFLTLCFWIFNVVFRIAQSVVYFLNVSFG